MQITSKLPNVGTTIFSVMSALATEHNAVNLAQGFPNFEMDPVLADLLAHYTKQGFNQYCPMPGTPALCGCIAELVKRCYDKNINPNTEVTVTSGATEAMFSAITAFVHRNDEVIILEPAYDSYRPAIELCGAKTVAFPLQAPSYRPDWEAIEKLVTPKTKMLILNTPHNPTGTILGDEDMKAAAKLVLKYNLLLLSDEVYEHLIFDREQHRSALRYPELWGRCITAHSFGKTFHNTGWRIGYVVAEESLMREFRKVHQYVTFCVQTPMQLALADYMKTPSTYLGLPSFYQEKRNQLMTLLQATRLQVLQPKGTFFMLADYSKISNENDLDFTKRLVSEFGVATIPLSPFYGVEHKPDTRIIRFCFAKTPDTLVLAAERLLKL